MKIKHSTIKDGVEICNTCGKPVDKPYRYPVAGGGERGCISTSHDVHVRVNKNPAWMKRTRYVLPTWITEARRKMFRSGDRGASA